MSAGFNFFKMALFNTLNNSCDVFKLGGESIFSLLQNLSSPISNYFSLHNYFGLTEQVVVASTKQCVTSLPG